MTGATVYAVTVTAYTIAPVTIAAVYAVAPEYPQSILKGTLTCHSYSDTALFEAYIAGQEDYGCVGI